MGANTAADRHREEPASPLDSSVGRASRRFEKRRNRELTGNFLENRPRRLDNRLENIREFSGLRDGPPEIPCARNREFNSS